MCIRASPLAVLAALGGLDIAAMAGACLGAAAARLPLLLDGFISTVAALAAVRLCPAAEAALLASHRSAEPAGQMPVSYTHLLNAQDDTAAVTPCFGPEHLSLADFTANAFAQADALVFVGAAGIAVRAIAPHPVSYTHLDVYKRQGVQWIRQNILK